MSTLQTADLDSDSDGDADYAPAGPSRPQKKRKIQTSRSTKLPSEAKRTRRAGSASGSSATATDSGDSSESSGDEAAGGAEAAALAAEKAKEEAEAEERRSKAQAEFAAMRAGTNVVPAAQDSGGSAVKGPVEMVDIQRTRRFAGETISETVSLPVTDPEAIAWLAKQSTTSEQGSSSAPTVAPADPATETKISPSNTSQAAPLAKLTGKPPVRRKPRQSLEQMSAALDKGSKMTTLEKSQLDWKSHMSSDSSIRDELEANRRSGGYLQKTDFLERVGDRRAEAFEKRK